MTNMVRMETRMAWCFVILFISLINVDARHKVESMSVNEGKAAKISSTMKLLEEIGILSSEVCHILPADLEAKCLETSRTYLHQTNLLFQGPSHEESHCNNTELCTDEDKSLIGIDIFMEEKILVKMLDERGCVACRRFAKELMTKLKQPKAKTKMMEVLIEYCEEVEEDEQLCKEIVYKYAPRVLSKLEKTKPSDLCRRMSMCVEEINM
ncbi:uncharacterized protein [Elaeis guineensis]|uniref:Uncharacterized protein LOC105059876 isoform X2 n=2 Tax=Elaeis guineensis var. tenera TaxID=51953 RepID=A0A6I9SEA9_ELAGV|nr:uncharacterized protein LOC105059876 isoform X2 [Elaeis guineensis]